MNLYVTEVVYAVVYNREKEKLCPESEILVSRKWPQVWISENRRPRWDKEKVASRLSIMKRMRGGTDS